MTTTSVRSNRAQLRAVMLPAEHGGWGFVLEPIVLGLLLSPTLAGLSIAFAALSVFLLRQPLKIVTIDYRRRRRYNRTALAERVILAYGFIGVVGLFAALKQAGPEILLPPAFALPLASVQLFFDARSDSRHWLPELTGPAALAMSAAAIVMAGGWQLGPALLVPVLLVARSIPAVLYVRARIRMVKGKQTDTTLEVLAHVVAILVAAGLASLVGTPWLAVLATGILLVRAVSGLQPQAQTVPAKTIGFQELAYGFLTVVIIAVGYHFAL